jgi:metal-responsive CopG/Arc/MetJ family transcriptional regulator
LSLAGKAVTRNGAAKTTRYVEKYIVIFLKKKMSLELPESLLNKFDERATEVRNESLERVQGRNRAAQRKKKKKKERERKETKGESGEVLAVATIGSGSSFIHSIHHLYSITLHSDSFARLNNAHCDWPSYIRTILGR